MRKTCALIAAATLAPCILTSQPAIAGGHTWFVNEIFSDSTGTIQFIEVKEINGGPFETGTAGHVVSSNSHSFTIPSNVAQPTSFRHILLATAGFAALPGAPTPDYIIVSNFLSANGDTIRYVPNDTFTFGVGVMPTDGVRSLNRDSSTGVNSPTNYAGQTGSVNAAPGPPAVPDGSGTSTPMTVEALDLSGSSLKISWDTASCSGAVNYQIIYGQGSQLPSASGGPFGVTDGVCAVGSTSPFTWNSVPVASDGSGLIWWLMVSVNASGTESSWGRDSAGVERLGPGAGGSSGVCSVTGRSLSNTCGH